MNATRLQNTTLLLALGIAVLGVGSADVHAKPDGDHVSGKDFVSWVKDSAIELDTLDWRCVDLSKLSALDRLLEGKRNVLLAEPDHCVHEKDDFRLIFIRHLFGRGWRFTTFPLFWRTSDENETDGRCCDRFGWSDVSGGDGGPRCRPRQSIGDVDRRDLLA